MHNIENCTVRASWCDPLDDGTYVGAFAKGSNMLLQHEDGCTFVPFCSSD